MSPTKRSIAQAKYDKKNTRRIEFKFNIETDKDILAVFDSVENIQAFIKFLVRRDIERKKALKNG